MATDIQPTFTQLNNMRYQTALIKAFGLHLLVLMIAFAAPHVFKNRFTLPDIQTVTLYSVAELEQQAPAVPERPARVEPPPVAPESVVEPVVEQPVVSINTQPAPEPEKPLAEPAPTVVSLKPVKRKKIINEPEIKPVVSNRVQEFRRQEAARELLAAQKKAELARQQALDRIRQNLNNRSVIAAETTVPTTPESAAGAAVSRPQSSAGGRGTVEVEEYLGQYVVDVNQLIRRHWQLPDLRNWDPDLEGIIIVKVGKNGDIIKSYFEKRSENKFYNQSLEKALESAGKLPPLPRELSSETYEFGLRFRLGDM